MTTAKKPPRVLDLVGDEKPRAPSAPVQRGRLLDVDDIRTEIFRDKVSDWWIRHKFAPDLKIKTGRKCFWYEFDAREWIEKQRVSA